MRLNQKTKAKESIWSYLVSYKLNSVFIRFFFIIVVSVLIPLIAISMLAYSYYSNDVKTEIMNAHERNLLKNKEIIDIIFEGVNELSVVLANDRQIGYFFDIGQWDRMSYDTIEKLKNIAWKTSVHTTEYIDSIYLYSEANEYVVLSTGELYSKLNMKDKQWYDTYKTNIDFNQSSYYYFRDVKDIGDGTSRKYITILRRIPFLGYNTEGVVVININVDVLENILNRSFEDFYIVNENDRILYNNNEELIEKDISKILGNDDSIVNEVKIRDDKKVIATVKANFNNYKYVSIIPLNQINKVTLLRKLLFIAVLVSILLSFVLALFITITIYKPFRDIISVVNNPDISKKNVMKKRRKKIDEIKYISNSILNYHSQKMKTNHDLIEQTEKLKSAQSMALQAQINPHFLYNTLHAISWMAMGLTGGENKVSKVINHLSKLLRISFQTKEFLTPLSQEIEHAKRYIEIEKIRFSNSFIVKWEIKEELFELMIVKIVLQPIIENAILHGLKNKDKNGKIIIKNIEDNKNLIIEISDNGQGISEEKLASIKKQLVSDEIKENNHIGLYNVNKRIQLLFGETYGVFIESEQRIGTKVKIVIPNIK